ncbi:MAG: hypothetical protein AAF050_02035 [Cyanobacteria bacterium J06649_5]
MGSLNEDLEKYQDEYYSKADLKAGIKLAMRMSVEFLGYAGAIALSFQLLAIASGVLSPIGLAIGPVVMAKLALNAGQSYSRLSTKERKQVRAFIKWINTGFNL